MSKSFWTVCISVTCVFWGTAILVHQHHLSVLIPTLGGYLLAFGIGLLVVFFWHEGHRS